jgi:hypothetical protein
MASDFDFHLLMFSGRAVWGLRLGRLDSDIVGSNFAYDMNVCVWECSLTYSTSAPPHSLKADVTGHAL